MIETIDLWVDDEGEIHVEAKGFKDGSCLDVLKEIEKMFGKATSVKLKSEARVKVSGETKVRS